MDTISDRPLLTSRLHHLATHRAAFVRGIQAALPVMIGILPFALVLGAQAGQKGLSIAEVPLMTGLNLAGGSEFAAIQLWTSPPHILLIVAMTFLINSRHLLMSAAYVPFLQHLPKRKVLPLLFLMCDESWAIGLAEAQQRAALGIERPFNIPFYLGTALSLWFSWMFWTAVGAVIGPRIGDVRSMGFDMAFPAVFFVLLSGMWQGWKPARAWIVSLATAALVYHTGPSGWYVAAGAVSGMLTTYFLAVKPACT